MKWDGYYASSRVEIDLYVCGARGCGEVRRISPDPAKGNKHSGRVMKRDVEGRHRGVTLSDDSFQTEEVRCCSL